ncbi:helix-turn-helix transcriptional regulator [Spirillospora sp. NPDC047279]|uniref:helix-turn-helix domain-containing protein n=1 Tax=Spirillospora sp. NPDC047279 TaxID=3155478 RepID=UPI0033EA1CF5
MNESPDPRTSMWHWISCQLRFLRKQNGWSGHALAELLHCARSSVSRLENGEAKLAPDQAEKIDEAWRTGGLFGVMVHYAMFASDPDWFKAHLELEARSSALWIYESNVVPGLLQTPEYARALFEAFGVRDLDGQVNKRMQRQERLHTTNAPMLWIVIGQAALEWWIGGPEVMREQLAKLLQVGTLPNVSVRVVPKTSGAHPGLAGAFEIMRIGRNDLVYTEALGGGRLVQTSAEVADFRHWYERIGAVALPENATRRLIERTMEATTYDPVAQIHPKPGNGEQLLR